MSLAFPGEYPAWLDESKSRLISGGYLKGIILPGSTGDKARQQTTSEGDRAVVSIPTGLIELTETDSQDMKA